MRARTKPLLLVSLLSLAACGDSAPAEPTATVSSGAPRSSSASSARLATSASPAPSGSGSAKAADATRPFLTGVDQAIREGAAMAGRLGFSVMRSKPWQGELVKERKGGRLLPRYEGCGDNPLDLLDAVAFSGDGKKLLAIGKITDPTKVGACLLSFGAIETTLEGRRAFSLGRRLLVPDGGFLAYGDKEWIADLLSGASKPDAKRAAAVELGKDELLAFTADRAALGGPVEKVSASLRSDDKAFELVVEVDVSDEASAKKIEKDLAGDLGWLPVKISTKGAHLTFTLKQEGDGAAQSAFVSDLADRAMKLVANYVTSSKAAEGKNTVGAISRAIQQTVEEQSLTAFPTSSTSVPAEVPKGTKVQSDKKDWTEAASWKGIKFMITEPQAFRYRWETAPDGKSVWVIAEGDLDGDGKLSVYKQKLELKDGKVVADKKLTIVDDGE